MKKRKGGVGYAERGGAVEICREFEGEEILSLRGIVGKRSVRGKVLFNEE